MVRPWSGAGARSKIFSGPATQQDFLLQSKVGASKVGACE